MPKDVFLCHNSKEKAEVERIRAQLLQQGIDAWLDKYDFEPFRRWQDQLEEIIPQVKAVAIFIGSSGVGPWADIEMQEFLAEFAKNHKLRIGLVILPGCPDKLINTVPRFLKGFHWVDFRQQNPDPMEQLIWGITGQKPKTHRRQFLKWVGWGSLGLVTSVVGGGIWSQRDQPGEPNTLKSEKGIDYTRLHDLLKAENWKEADKETYRVMIQTLGKKDGELFNRDELLNFPCTDLGTIDGLWVKYSNGHFGFSIQKEIYLSVGNKVDGTFYEKAWDKFGDRIGWKVESSWISYSQITFDTSSPRGHLPVMWRCNGNSCEWGGGRMSSLALRLVNCNI